MSTMVVVVNRIPTIAQGLDAKFHELAKKGLDTAVEVADREVPVDTSKLKDEAYTEDRWDGSKELALIYDARNTSGDPYGRYVEFGTRFMSAQPFILPAAYAAMKTIADQAESVLS